MKLSSVLSLLTITYASMALSPSILSSLVFAHDLQENDACQENPLNLLRKCYPSKESSDIVRDFNLNSVESNAHLKGLLGGEFQLGDCSQAGGVSFDFGALPATAPLPSDAISGLRIDNAGAYNLGSRFADSYSLSSGIGLAQSVSGFPHAIPESKAIQMTFEHDPGNNGLEEVSVKVLDVGSAGIRMEAFDENGDEVDAEEKFGSGVGVGHVANLTVKGTGIRSIKIFQPQADGMDGVLVVQISSSCPVKCPGIEIPSFDGSTEYCLVNRPRQSEQRQREVCRGLGGDLTGIDNIPEFSYLSKRIPETVFIDSWQNDDYGDDVCIVFWPGGAVTEAPLSCKGPYAGLCEIPIYKKKN